MELLITKSELPVFNCLKYTALMEHIDDRHISRETPSQISLARSNSEVGSTIWKVLQLETKTESDDEFDTHNYAF